MKGLLNTSDIKEKLEKMFHQEVRNKAYYNQKFLQSDATPDDFFKEIAHKVNLEKLYKIEKIFVSGKDPSYCPVLLEITDPYLQKDLKCKYLLQLWGNNQRKYTQIPMNSKPTMANENYTYFYFQPGTEDQGHDEIHIYLNENSKSKLILQGIFETGKEYKYLSMYEGEKKLVLANDHEIKFIQFSEDYFTTEGERTEVIHINELTAQTVTPRLPLKGIYKDYFAFETADNQLDFNTLWLHDFEDNDKFHYKFVQYAEIIPRGIDDWSNDPVTRVVYKIIDDFSYAVAQKKSGRFDLYWDYQRKFSSIDIYAKRVELTPTTFYFEIEDQEGKPTYWKIEHKSSRVLNWEMAEQITDPDFNLDHIHHMAAAGCFALFVDLMVGQSTHNTYTAVAHQNYFSLYNMIKDRWVKHVKFLEGEIKAFFRLSKIDSNHEQDDADIVVILNNGSVYFLTFEQVCDEKRGTLIVDAKQKTLELGGEYYHFRIDRVYEKYAIIKFYDYSTSVYRMGILYNRTFHEIQPSQFEFDQFSSQTILVPIRSQDENENLIFKQDRGKESIGIYHLNFHAETAETQEKKDDEEEPEEKEEKGEEEAEEKGEDEEGDKDKDVTEDQENTYQEESKFQGENTSILQVNEDEEIFEKEDFTGPEISMKITLIKSVKNVHDYIDGEMANIHSIVLYKAESPKKVEEKEEDKKDDKKEEYKFSYTHVFFFDYKDMYVMKIGRRKLYTKPNQHCATFISFTQEVCYALCNGKNPGESGLFYYNLDEIVKNLDNEEIKTLAFKEFDLGENNTLFFCQEENRIGYFNLFSYITVVPLLHSNKIRYVGMREASEYVAYQVFEDDMMTLNKKGKVKIWNLLTGKFESEKKLQGVEWLESYDLHDPESNGNEGDMKKRGKILFRSQENLENTKLEDHYEAFQMNHTLENQTTYIENLEKTIKHWKYVELQNSKSFVTHLEFDHPHYTFQHLYISSDNQLMIERQLYSKVYLYRAIPLEGNHVRWQLVRKLEDYDRDLEAKNLSYVPFYSPDFSYHISLDRKNLQFVIKETITNKVFKVIPKDLMTFDFTKKIIPLQTVNRMQWIDNRHIRIVNKEGFEKIFDFQEDFKEVAYNYIPEFTEVDIHEDFEQLPYYYERSHLDYDDVEELLLRKYQQYKSAYYLLKKRDMKSLYNILFNVERHDIQYANLSFTFLHWSLVFQISQGKINLTDINETQVQPLLYNIFPQGQTILHYLIKFDQGDDIQTLFSIAHGKAEHQGEIVYHIPILPNINGESPLHIAKEAFDYKSIDTLLKNLAIYKVDHHTAAITDILPHIIEKDLPSLPQYLTSRLQQTEQVKQVLKAKLKKDYNDTIAFQVWHTKEDFHRELVDEKENETRIKGEYIDVGGIYHYLDPNFQDFFDNLAGTENFDLFKIKTLQKVIEFNFPLVKEYTVKRLFIPYVAFLTAFVLYYNMFFETYLSLRNKEVRTETEESSYIAYRNANFVYIAGLIAFATYFLMNEARQFWAQGFDYIFSVWNYIDILPPLGLYLSIFLSFDSSVPDPVRRQVEAFTTFFMWMKLLYFMRIFKNTGYLIRMIITVIYDMRHFFLVLLIGLFAFSDSFLSIALGNEGDDQFVKGFVNSIIYTYTVILGGFDITHFDNSIAYAFVITLFLICTIFNMIVMLNLLIAIISESFANVNSNAKNAMYQEMASLIAENNYLIPDNVKESYAPKDQVLLVITDLEAVDQEFSDPVKNQINDLWAQIDEYHTEMENTIKSYFEGHSNVHSKDIKSIKDTLDTITKQLAAMNKKDEGAADDEEDYSDEDDE